MTTNRAQSAATADLDKILDGISSARRWDGALGTPDAVASNAVRKIPVPDQYREVIGYALLLIGLIEADLPEHARHQLGNCLGLAAERILRGER